VTEETLKAAFRAYIKVGIVNPKIQDIALRALENLPDHFWTQPSSSTGKYHPKDEHGHGGLALHTLRVCEIADTLIESQTTIDSNAIRLAALFHDAGRFGFKEKPSKHSLDEHPGLSAHFLVVIKNISCSSSPTHQAHQDLEVNITMEKAYNAILTHTGKWGKHLPRTTEEWLLHYADTIAAKYTP